jgi:hypothetical protein
MRLRDILLYVETSSGFRDRLRITIGLARQHDAHLVGLFGIEGLSLDPLSYASEASHLNTGELIALQTERRETSIAEACNAQREFEALTGQAGISYEWRVTETTPSV